jgi:hypothetical protein
MGTQPGDFALTPRGYRHHSLVHCVKGGTSVRREPSAWTTRSAEGLIGRVSPSPLSLSDLMPSPATGWVSYADWQNSSGTPVSLFESTWRVPPLPKTISSQTIFLFNALQTTEQDHILQPVLQWGQSAAPGSGQGWTIASWWVGRETEPLFITESTPVSVGDVLVGRIALLAQNGSLFSYTCEFAGMSATKLVAENLPQLTDCTETLEAYGVTTDAEYPATDKTAFSSIELQVGGEAAQLSWAGKGSSPAEVISNSASNGEVDVMYPKGET